MAQGKKTGGRQKGTPNRTTVAVKDAIQQAFEELGGAAYLVTVAHQEPKAFCTLLGKLVPSQVGGDPENPIQAEVNIGSRDLAKALARILAKGLPGSQEER